MQRLVVLMKQMFLFDVAKLNWNSIVRVAYQNNNQTRIQIEYYMRRQHACCMCVAHVLKYTLYVVQKKNYRLQMVFAILVCARIIYEMISKKITIFSCLHKSIICLFMPTHGHWNSPCAHVCMVKDAFNLCDLICVKQKSDMYIYI